MFHKTKLMSVLAVLVAVSMILSMVSISFADGQKPNSTATVCVTGYVINHREMPVDGTKFDPPLMVYADVVDAGTSAAAPVEATAPVTPTMPMTDTAAVTGTAPMTGTEAVTVTQEQAPAAMPSHDYAAEVGADGKWSFTDLPADQTYSFSMMLPTDWDGIVPQAPRGGIAETGAVTLSAKKGCYDVLFKIRRWIDVTVLKWEELRDGTVQYGQDWTVTAYPQGDPFAVKKSGKTDANGGVVLQLTPGTWKIKETIKAGWTPITPPEVTITLDQYAPSGAGDPVMFKNQEPVCHASITVEKNGLGTDASGQQVWLGPLSGWKITLSRADGYMTPVTKMTDGAGKTTFDNLIPGVYQVKETVQPGWKPLSANPQQVVIQDCENARVLFENLEVAGHLGISGTKYFKAWVPPYQGQTIGISGWAITATLKGTDPEVSIYATTDALGNYAFSEADLAAAGMAIPGATVTVCEEKRDHWIPVSPTCKDVRFPYPIPTDYTGAVVDFTNMQDPPPGGAGVSFSGDASCSMSYQVQAGDNLSAIAARNGTSVSALAQLNGLANPNMIRIGQTLCIQ